MAKGSRLIRPRAFGDDVLYNSGMFSPSDRAKTPGFSVIGLEILLGLLGGLVFFHTVLAAPVNEEHRYSISLWGIPAGTATMKTESLTSDDGRSLRRFMTTIRSNDFISTFFPVRNDVESIVDARTMLPQRLLFRRREGSRRENFDVTFDRVTHQATVLKDGESSVHSIVQGTHDLLSCLYYLRTMPNLVPGSSVYLNVHHDRKNYEVEVKVEAVEPISGPWGNVEVIRMLAVMPFRGIFLNEGNIRFWLTNTAERVPVMMEARVIVGSVRALIEGWTPQPESFSTFLQESSLERDSNLAAQVVRWSR